MSRNEMRQWLARPATDVAPDLLGCVIRHESDDGIVAVRLTEVEAYMGGEDPGSHAYRGQTPRNAVMFGEAGHLYVYFTYGMHFCANIVCGAVGCPTAVLLRGGEVVEGEELARKRRAVARSARDLARGPARLASALGLGRELNGVDVLSDTGGVSLGSADEYLDRSGRRPVASGPRVGVAGEGGDARRFPWRYWLEGEPTVSRYRAGVSRRGRST